MYTTLLVLHNAARWLVLIFILYWIYRGFVGYTQNKSFTIVDNSLRHWAATIAHIQLMLGVVLYTQSPIVKGFWAQPKAALQNFDLIFFGLIHFILMVIAIVFLTVGSAKAKRTKTDKEKFKTILIWFSIALVIIFIAIPWPFSPLTYRPYLRTF